MSMLGIANVVSTGAGINYIGDHAYAYSGSIAADDNYTTLLSFDTGYNTYIRAKLQPVMNEAITDDYEFRIQLNGELVLTTFTNSYRDSSPYEEIELIIPGNSTVLIDAKNRTGSSSQVVGFILTGRVYA
jgi:hypothetical protein